MLNNKIRIIRKDGKMVNAETNGVIESSVLANNPHRISKGDGFYAEERNLIPITGLPISELSKVAICPAGFIICACGYDEQTQSWVMESGEFKRLVDKGCTLHQIHDEDVRGAGWHDNNFCLCGIGKKNKQFLDGFKELLLEPNRPFFDKNQMYLF
jgi:hypothetical protein